LDDSTIHLFSQTVANFCYFVKLHFSLWKHC